MKRSPVQLTQKHFIVGFFIAGVLFLILAMFVGQFDGTKYLSKSYPLARVYAFSENVMIYRKSLMSYEKVKGKNAIYSFDSIETDAKGEASLEFMTGDHFHLSANSYVTIDQEREGSVLMVQRGNLEVERTGNSKLLVAIGGHRYSVTELQQIQERNLEQLDSVNPTSSVAKSPALKKNIPKQTLSKEYIEATLRNHKSHFYKCYTQLLQKKPGVTGYASLNFTIEHSGKIITPEVSFSSITDTYFTKCLVEALRRIEFSSYHGESMTAVFPLRFE